MNTITNFRSKTMKRAWSIYRNTKKAFSVCLSKAWRAYKLTKLMKEQVVEFTFERVDGSFRRAKGTLNVPSYSMTTGGRGNFKSVVYWDIERGDFRAFRTENLISIHI